LAPVSKRRRVGDAGQGRDVEHAEQAQQLDLVAERKAGDVHLANAQDADQGYSPDQQRDRRHCVQYAHQRLFQPAAVEEAGEQPQSDATATTDDDGEGGNLERCTAAPNDPA
jgi:hypothetical protein